MPEKNMPESSEEYIEEQEKKNPEKKGKGKKVFLWIVVCLIILYFVGVYVFSKYSYPGTSINGKSRSFYRISEVAEPGPLTTPLTVEGRDGEKAVVSAEEINLDLEAEGNPVHQNSFAWPRDIFQRHSYELEYDSSYDEKALENLLEEGGFKSDGPMPEDAEIGVKDGEVIIKEEKPGDHIDGEALNKEIIQSLVDGKKFLDVRSLYAKPKKTKEDPEIVKGYKILKKYEDTKMTYDMLDRKYTFGIDEIYKALEFNKDGSASWKDSVLVDWVNKMAKETDTYGKAKKFKTHDGKEITVPPGIYGWQIKVKDTAESLKDALNEGGQKELEPVYRNAGLYRGKNDIGDTYIEIDLSLQQMWCYMKGKELFHGDIKSGAVNDYAETPVGVHKIWSHDKDKTLKGTRKDGSTYELPVKYWMPINYGGVGLHDASWTKDFGGTYYIKDGSNGCINLPESTAKFIFENYPNNTPVVIYESKTDYSPADDTF